MDSLSVLCLLILRAGKSAPDRTRVISINNTLNRGVGASNRDEQPQDYGEAMKGAYCHHSLAGSMAASVHV